LEEAAAHYQRALELYRELGDPTQLIVGVLHMKLGRLGMRRGDREAALKHCGRGWPLIEHAGDRLSQAERTEYAALREELLRVEGPPPAALPLRRPRSLREVFKLSWRHRTIAHRISSIIRSGHVSAGIGSRPGERCSCLHDDAGTPGF
jgi:hypothetical protein